MASKRSLLFGLVGLSVFASAAPTATEPRCPILLDGRLPANVTPALFDTDDSPFGSKFVLGENLTFSQIVRIPSIPPSRFDAADGKAFEVSINDKSIFKPGSGELQKGFRRVGLIPRKNDGKDASTQGLVTFHWSVRASSEKPANLTHEYLNVWHETNDYSGNQFNFECGSLIGREAQYPKDNWKLLNKKGDVIFQTKIRPDTWQNFAVTLDYNLNTIRVYYSRDDTPLAVQGAPTSNDNSGGGQFQVGILKKPISTDPDVSHKGFQPSGIDERLTYAGVYVEDGQGACVSL